VATCQAAKLRAAGKRAACLAAEQADVLPGKPSDPAACEASFDEAAAAADAAARGGARCRFVDDDDGTISDLNTLLQWEKDDTGGKRQHDDGKGLLMKVTGIVSSAAAALVAVVVLGTSVRADTLSQVGHSGKTYASSVVTCAADPTGALLPVVEAGLLNPKRHAKAVVSLNGTFVATVTTADPAVDVWLVEGDNTVAVALSKKRADRYAFSVQPGMCDTSGNTFSADGTLEYAASGKSYATVTPGCAWNPTTGQGQPFVNLFDGKNASGAYYLLNVSVNGVPLTQLSFAHPHTPVFLSAGWNVISAANASLSIDYYVRDGGDGTCPLP
jgi:hypothetical protein